MWKPININLKSSNKGLFLFVTNENVQFQTKKISLGGVLFVHFLLHQCFYVLHMLNTNKKYKLLIW